MIPIDYKGLVLSSVFFTCRVAVVLSILFLLYNCAGRYMGGEEKRMKLQSEKFAPRKMEGKKPAILLLHGFGGSPYDFRPLTKALEKEGWAYEAILLPGHGTTPRELREVTSEELIQASLEAYDRLEEEHGEVVVAGFSMGGALALNVAAEREPEGIILFGAYVEVTRKWYYFGRAEDWARRLHKILPYVSKIGTGNVNDPFGKKNYDSYHRLPVKTVMELEKLSLRASENHDNIHCPVLWFHSVGDIAANYNAASDFFQKLPPEKKEFVTYKRSNHIILFDYDRDDAIKKSMEFLEETRVK